ncbi:hypothetical protein K6K15_03895 [Lacticaseibacillus paracasei]|uniref:hypothetical protein n=1 Tax=Lacticaseibacillus paracasei TaxID=1597 RepID=UPI00272972A7|nr:hypothetical protein [Lacticaseibacillus paracasei]WKZ96891.1 hypothetical protein K6K15_03895 [Lacticaseibacillus paracasei]
MKLGEIVNTSLVFQTFILSGALGLVGLEYLQDHDAVTRTLSDSDKNVYRVIIGTVAYMVYLVLYSLISTIEEFGQVKVILSIFATMAILFFGEKGYVIYAKKHLVEASGASRLDARETAFTNPYSSEGYIQADMFDLTGKYIGSGLLDKVNLMAGTSHDVTLVSLPSGYKAHSNQHDADAASYLCYIDTESGIKYYLTYFSAPVVE